MRRKSDLYIGLAGLVMLVGLFVSVVYFNNFLSFFLVGLVYTLFAGNVFFSKTYLDFKRVRGQNDILDKIKKLKSRKLALCFSFLFVSALMGGVLFSIKSLIIIILSAL